MLDAELYGLDREDLAYILRDGDHPVERMGRGWFTRGLDPGVVRSVRRAGLLSSIAESTWRFLVERH